MTGCRRALVAAAVALVSALATMAGALVLLDLDGIETRASALVRAAASSFGAEQVR